MPRTYRDVQSLARAGGWEVGDYGIVRADEVSWSYAGETVSLQYDDGSAMPAFLLENGEVTYIRLERVERIPKELLMARELFDA
jgi:hypothetical protein